MGLARCISDMLSNDYTSLRLHESLLQPLVQCVKLRKEEMVLTLLDSRTQIIHMDRSYYGNRVEVLPYSLLTRIYLGSEKSNSYILARILSI